MLNKNLLKGKIVENGMSIRTLAREMSINEATLHRKLNGTSDFTRKEIQKIVSVLSLTSNDIEDIFFAA